MRLITLLLLCSYLPAALFAQKNTMPVDEVNPHIGTAHSRWFHFTPGAVPFAMAKPGPPPMGIMVTKMAGKLLVMIIGILQLKGLPTFMNFRWEVWFLCPLPVRW
jgi:hypothetical protein